ncbi:MAG: hypothetical protein K2K45_05310 [Muribaculaceae bacterium]|nr:hypothetical protein [Muribaculaceae bacterium]MDE7096075.1 hypothetical protein [Muribaculaceae bacterium]
MKSDNSFKMQECSKTARKIENEIRDADRKMNLDAPFADVDPQAADMPDSIVDDL